MINVPGILVKMNVKKKLAVVILLSALVSLCLIIVVHKQKRNEGQQSEAIINSAKYKENIKEMLIEERENVNKHVNSEQVGERKDIMDQEAVPQAVQREEKENDKTGKEGFYDDKVENDKDKTDDKTDDNGEDVEEEDEGREEPKEEHKNEKQDELNVERGAEQDDEYNDDEEDSDDDGGQEEGQFEVFHDAEKYLKHANLQMVEEEEDDGEPDEDDPEDDEDHEAFGEENVDEDDGEPNAPNELFDDGEDEVDKPMHVIKENENFEDSERDDKDIVNKEENERVHYIELDHGGVRYIDNNINGDEDGGNESDLKGKESDGDDDRDDGHDENGNAGEGDGKDDEENDNEEGDDDDGIVEVETDIGNKIVHDET